MRLIDIENIDYVRLEDSLHCLEHHKGDEVECVICAPTVEAIPKADYENRLKSDLEAILTEIQLEIEELDSNHTMPDVWSNQASKEIWNTALKLIEEIIEVRINNLKGMTKECEESG